MIGSLFYGEMAKTPIIFVICNNTQKNLISQKRFLQSSFFLFHLAITPINCLMFCKNTYYSPASPWSTDSALPHNVAMTKTMVDRNVAMVNIFSTTLPIEIVLVCSGSMTASLSNVNRRKEQIQT
jgi:hypothetical protein